MQKQIAILLAGLLMLSGCLGGADPEEIIDTVNELTGCTDPTATNYDQNATLNGTGCQYETIPDTTTDISGCMDTAATNYNQDATVDDGSCTYPVSNVSGCMDINATNYNMNATVDDGTCSYPPADINGCMDTTAFNYNQTATADDGSCITPTMLTSAMEAFLLNMEDTPSTTSNWGFNYLVISPEDDGNGGTYLVEMEMTQAYTTTAFFEGTSITATQGSEEMVFHHNWLVVQTSGGTDMYVHYGDDMAEPFIMHSVATYADTVAYKLMDEGEDEIDYVYYCSNDGQQYAEEMGGILCPEGEGVTPTCPDGQPCVCIDIDGSCDDGDDDWGYVDEGILGGDLSTLSFTYTFDGSHHIFEAGLTYLGETGTIDVTLNDQFDVISIQGEVPSLSAFEGVQILTDAEIASLTSTSGYASDIEEQALPFDIWTSESLETMGHDENGDPVFDELYACTAFVETSTLGSETDIYAVWDDSNLDDSFCDEFIVDESSWMPNGNLGNYPDSFVFEMDGMRVQLDMVEDTTSGDWYIDWTIFDWDYMMEDGGMYCDGDYDSTDDTCYLASVALLLDDDDEFIYIQDTQAGDYLLMPYTYDETTGSGGFALDTYQVFVCDSGDEWIDSYAYDDGILDCADGSDEPNGGVSWDYVYDCAALVETSTLGSETDIYAVWDDTNLDDSFCEDFIIDESSWTPNGNTGNYPDSFVMDMDGMRVQLDLVEDTTSGDWYIDWTIFDWDYMMEDGGMYCVGDYDSTDDTCYIQGVGMLIDSDDEYIYIYDNMDEQYILMPYSYDETTGSGIFAPNTIEVFVCDSGDEWVYSEYYDDGSEDCADGSDEPYGPYYNYETMLGTWWDGGVEMSEIWNCDIVQESDGVSSDPLWNDWDNTNLDDSFCDSIIDWSVEGTMNGNDITLPSSFLIELEDDGTGNTMVARMDVMVDEETGDVWIDMTYIEWDATTGDGGMYCDGDYDSTDDTCYVGTRAEVYDGDDTYLLLYDYYDGEIMIRYSYDETTGSGMMASAYEVFVCDSGDEWVPAYWVGDGDEDCTDGSDELYQPYDEEIGFVFEIYDDFTSMDYVHFYLMEDWEYDAYGPGECCTWAFEILSQNFDETGDWPTYAFTYEDLETELGFSLDGCYVLMAYTYDIESNPIGESWEYFCVGAMIGEYRIVADANDFMFEGDANDYSIALEDCTTEYDSETGEEFLDCAYVAMINIAEVLVTSVDDVDMAFESGSCVVFLDDDDSGTVSEGDVIYVDHECEVELGMFNTVRLYSESAQAYSDENPVLPGFTGVLATVSLFGAAFIRRDE